VNQTIDVCNARRHRAGLDDSAEDSSDGGGKNEGVESEEVDVVAVSGQSRQRVRDQDYEPSNSPQIMRSNRLSG